MKKKAIAEKREKLQKHSETHIEIKTDIQVGKLSQNYKVKNFLCILTYFVYCRSRTNVMMPL